MAKTSRQQITVIRPSRTAVLVQFAIFYRVEKYLNFKKIVKRYGS